MSIDTNATPLTVGIVIPTRNEPPHQVAALVHEIRGHLPEVRLVIVDDSDPEKWELFEREFTADLADAPVELIHRTGSKRWGRLAGAVHDGFNTLKAYGTQLAGCIDGDGQHNPAALPEMVRLLTTTSTGVVVGSRFSHNGSPGAGLTRVRLAMSRACHAAAKTLFPTRTRGCTDTMSGFFMLRLSEIDLDNTWVHRFKVLLQMLVQHPEITVAEAGFTMRSRDAGESNVDMKEAWAYVACLAKLFQLAYLRRGPRSEGKYA